MRAPIFIFLVSSNLLFAQKGDSALRAHALMILRNDVVNSRTDTIADSLFYFDGFKYTISDTTIKITRKCVEKVIGLGQNLTDECTWVYQSWRRGKEHGPHVCNSRNKVEIWIYRKGTLKYRAVKILNPI